MNNLQAVAYTYNERGWLLTNNATLFNEQLQYNSNALGFTGFSAQYNGNIGSQTWSGTNSSTDTYTYLYDKLNRLTSGSCTNGYTENNIIYDVMGNITALNRYQTASNTWIDALSYSYLSGTTPTNQLQTLTDGTTSNLGAKSGTSTYAYDVNGNVTTDPSRIGGTVNFTYNLLNLPATVTGAKTITYTYDAAGNKLRRVSNGTGNTDYVKGIQYEAGTMAFIQTEEGKAVPAPAGANAYYYYYTLSDHLGNSRVMFDTHTGSTATLQTDDYYPFGMEIARTTPSVKNEYLYNKKELQEELGELDYGARFYDPVIGRFTTIDPLAEIDRRWSPYNYTFGDPIRFTDPDGMWPDGDCCGVVGAFAGGLYDDLKGAVVGTVQAVIHPVNTLTGLAKLGTDPVTQIQAGLAVYGAATEGYQKFKTGDANVKAAMIGGLVGEAGQLFGGEFAEAGKVGKLGEVGKLAEGASDLSKIAEGTKGAAKGSLGATKEALAEAKAKIGLEPTESLAKGEKGKFGSPQRGTSKKGYRLDPAHPNAKPGTGEEFPHVNFWDYTNGKRGSGGISGAIPIKQ